MTSTNTTADQRLRLLEEKRQVDEKLFDARIALQRASTLAATTGKFLPRDEFSALQQNVKRLGSESQRLQIELSRLRRKDVLPFSAFVALAAREVLPRDKYEEVLERARELEAASTGD